MNSEENEDEISLIDLFVVLIKFRKLILTLTCTLFLLSSAGYLANTFFTQKKNNVQANPLQTKTASTEVTLASINRNITNLIDTDYETFAMNQILSPEKMSVAYMFDSISDKKILNKDEYFEFLKNTYKDISILISKKNKFTICLKTTGEEDAESKLKQVLKNMNSLLYQEYLEKVKSDSIRIKNDLVNFTSKSKDVYQVLINLDDIYTSFINSEFNFYTYSTIATSADTSTGASKKRLVLVIFVLLFASLFISIFIAFVTEAVSNIKNNPIESEKIKKAWIAGK